MVRRSHEYLIAGSCQTRDEQPLLGMEKLLALIKDMNTWKRIIMLATVCTIFLSTYLGYVEISKYEKLSGLDPWDYFELQEINDKEGLQKLLNSAKEDLGCDAVSLFLYQPKDMHFYRDLVVMSPQSTYNDYEKSENRIPLYNMHKLIHELKDANLSVITMTSGHYDSKFLIAEQFDVSYVVPISIRHIHIGHIIFSYKNKPESDIPFKLMKSISERSKLKIF